MTEKIWNNVRGAGRLVALLVLIAGSAFDYAARRSHRQDAGAKARWLQSVCRSALLVLAVEVESRGEPARGAIIAANHLGYLDILVLASLTPVVFVAKREVRSWPLFGWFAEKAGTRFIDRNRRGDVARIADEIGPVITERLTVVVFLEGTSTDGADVLPFKPSLLEPAVQNGWPVIPAGISYKTSAGRRVTHEVCWWGDMTLAPHLWNFTTLPWVRARVVWGEAVAAGGDRKVLAVRLRELVSRLRA